MKTLFTKLNAICTFLLFFVSIAVNGQDTLNNQGFNRWAPSGKQPPFDWKEPQGWTSSNPLTEFISAGVTQIQLAQSGSQQARIATLDIFGQAVPGILINGDFSYTLNDTSKFPLLGGEPATVVNLKLYGMYNYTSTDATDSATISVAYKKFNTVTKKPDMIAFGSTQLKPTTVGLNLFEVPLKMIGGSTPDSVVVTMLSSKVNNFKKGGVLIVDMVGFSKPTSVFTTTINNTKINVWPSPAKNQISIDLQDGGYSYAIHDVTGKQLLHGHSYTPTGEINVESLPAGVYFVKIDGGVLGTVRFVKE